MRIFGKTAAVVVLLAFALFPPVSRADDGPTDLALLLQEAFSHPDAPSLEGAKDIVRYQGVIALFQGGVPLGAEFQLITPGIRPTNSDAGDQKRIMTPSDAVRSGATYLVIGRPITQAQDPIAVLSQINQEIDQATSAKM